MEDDAVLIGADDLVAREIEPRALRRAAARANTTILIGIAGAVCATRFSSPAVAEIFARRFADLVPERGRPVLQAFAVHDPELGQLFWRSGGTVYHWPGEPLPDHIVAFLADAVAITEFFEAHPDGAVSLHAAAVGNGDAVAAIIGNSNVGKTTTALACARAGLRLYSDERCALVGGNVHPFPRAVNVRAGGRSLLLGEAANDPLAVYLRNAARGDLSDVRYGEIFPNWRAPAPRPLRSIFVLSGAAEQVAIEPATGVAVARAALRWTHGAGRGLERLATMLALFENVACHAMILGSPHASAQAIADTLRQDAERLRSIA